MESIPGLFVGYGSERYSSISSSCHSENDKMSNISAHQMNNVNSKQASRPPISVSMSTENMFNLLHIYLLKLTVQDKEGISLRGSTFLQLECSASKFSKCSSVSYLMVGVLLSPLPSGQKAVVQTTRGGKALACV